MSQLNSTEIKQLVSELEDLLSGPTVSLVLGNISVHIISNLLGATPEKLSSSSNRFILLLPINISRLKVVDKCLIFQILHTYIESCPIITFMTFFQQDYRDC